MEVGAATQSISPLDLFHSRELIHECVKEGPWQTRPGSRLLFVLETVRSILTAVKNDTIHWDTCARDARRQFLQTALNDVGERLPKEPSLVLPDEASLCDVLSSAVHLEARFSFVPGQECTHAENVSLELAIPLSDLVELKGPVFLPRVATVFSVPGIDSVALVPLRTCDGPLFLVCARGRTNMAFYEFVQEEKMPFSVCVKEKHRHLVDFLRILFSGTRIPPPPLRSLSRTEDGGNSVLYTSRYMARYRFTLADVSGSIPETIDPGKCVYSMFNYGRSLETPATRFCFWCGSPQRFATLEPCPWKHAYCERCLGQYAGQVINEALGQGSKAKLSKDACTTPCQKCYQLSVLFDYDVKCFVPFGLMLKIHHEGVQHLSELSAADYEQLLVGEEEGRMEASYLQDDDNYDVICSQGDHDSDEGDFDGTEPCDMDCAVESE